MPPIRAVYMSPKKRYQSRWAEAKYRPKTLATQLTVVAHIRSAAPNAKTKYDEAPNSLTSAGERGFEASRLRQYVGFNWIL